MKLKIIFDWKVFKNSSNSTKKILHFLLGERNEHKITEAGLKEVGLHKVYEEFGEKVMREARNFLADETLRQIKEGRLEEYIEGKKLKLDELVSASYRPEQVQEALDTLDKKTKVIMQVHDELVFEVPQDEVDWVRTEIPSLMAGVAELKVPLLAEVGVGPNWDKAH